MEFSSPKNHDLELELDRKVLLQVAVCVVPSMTLVATGRFLLGASVFFGLLSVILCVHLFQQDRTRFACLLLGVLPALMFFRSIRFFVSVPLLFGVCVLLWAIVSPKEFAQLWNRLRWKAFFFVGLLYWVASFYNTGSYTENLKVLELVLGAAIIYLLAIQWRYLATGLVGLAIAIVSIGFAFLPFGERLGRGEIGGVEIGNPTSFALPLTIAFVVSIADNGKWMLLEQRIYWRVAICMVSGAFLILSTSRGSWLVIIVNLLALLVINRRQRKMLVVFLGLLVIVGALMLSTSRGDYVEESFERTLSQEKSLSTSTSGRSDQWWLFPEVFADSPVWGFGPGSGVNVYAQYSLSYNMFLSGRYQSWHSLFLHIGVEGGAIGLVILGLLLVPLLFRGVSHWRISGDTMPLLGILSFLSISMSVSGLDVASAVYLGFGFLSLNWRSPRIPTRYE